MDEEVKQFQNDLLESVKQMKQGKAVRVIQVSLSPTSEVRAKVGMLQSAFAKPQGVSVRTLQE